MTAIVSAAGTLRIVSCLATTRATCNVWARTRNNPNSNPVAHKPFRAAATSHHGPDEPSTMIADPMKTSAVNAKAGTRGARTFVSLRNSHIAPVVNARAARMPPTATTTESSPTRILVKSCVRPLRTRPRSARGGRADAGSAPGTSSANEPRARGGLLGVRGTGRRRGPTTPPSCGSTNAHPRRSRWSLRRSRGAGACRSPQPTVVARRRWMAATKR